MNLRESNWRLDWIFPKCLIGDNSIDRTASCDSFLQDLLLKINIVMNDKCNGKCHEIYSYCKKKKNTHTHMELEQRPKQVLG